jgi:hypothetical protein
VSPIDVIGDEDEVNKSPFVGVSSCAPTNEIRQDPDAGGEMRANLTPRGGMISVTAPLEGRVTVFIIIFYGQK